MALSLILPNEPMLVSAIKVTIYGDPSIGKSTLGMTAGAVGSDVLVIDADQGTYRVGRLRRSPVQTADTWEQISCLTESDLEPFKTIVIDTAGRLLDVIKVHVAKNKANVKRDGTLIQSAYGLANNIFQTFVNRMIGYGKNVVFLAHALEDKDGDTVIQRPDIGGKNRQEVNRLVDCMAYYTNERDHNGKKEKLLRFSHNERFHTKDCANLGDIVVPDLAQNPTFLNDLIEHIKSELNAMSPEQKAHVELEQGWLTWQRECHEANYASDFNALMVQLSQNVGNPHYQGMWTCLKTCATHLNMAFDKNTKRWSETEAA